MSSSSSNKQFVYLIRYGLTDPPLLENVGNYDSDIEATVGVEHAHCIARAMATLPCDERPSVVLADPFLRCTHTASIIAEKLQEENNQRLLKIEEGVTEWMVPNLLVDKDGIMTYPSTVQELKEKFPNTIDDSYHSVNPVVWENDNDQADRKPWFPESEQELFARVETTLERILQNLPSHSNVAIVSHAPCLQAMALVLEGKKNHPSKTKVVKPWNLGGISCFSRDTTADVHGNVSLHTVSWKCEYFSATQHMPEGEYRDGTIGAWSLPTFDNNVRSLRS
jgi:broad specificity phosphatase PhoE